MDSQLTTNWQLGLCLIKSMEKYIPDKCCIYNLAIGMLPPRFQPFSHEGSIDSIQECSGLFGPNGYSFFTPVFTLQEFLNATGLKPNYIHANIEGSETALIYSYDFRHKPETWAIETHRNLSCPRDIAAILEKNGYSTFFRPPLEFEDPHTMVIAYLE